MPEAKNALPDLDAIAKFKWATVKRHTSKGKPVWTCVLQDPDDVKVYYQGQDPDDYRKSIAVAMKAMEDASNA